MLTTLCDFFEKTLEQFPDRIAVHFKGQAFSYRALDRMCWGLIATLNARGVKLGDRVIVCLGNRIETVVAFWACLRMGVCVSVIAADQPLDKIRFILADTDPKAMICLSSLVEKIDQDARFLQGDCLLFSVEKSLQVAPQESAHVLSFAACVASCDGPLKNIPRPISVDLASIIFTSGSTGEPKGVIMGHDNMVAACRSITTYLNLKTDDTILVVLPFSFDYGLYQMIMAGAIGATLVLEESVLNPALLFKRIEEYHCTVFPVVPSLASLLAEFYPKTKANVSSLKTVTNTGATLTERHIEALLHMFPSARVFSMYGLTECKRCTYLPPEDLKRKPGSVGIAIPDTEIYIVDEQDNRCAFGQVGQLVVRGNTVMRGYWQRPELSEARLRIDPNVQDRRLYTGDFGYLDEEGYFYFVGRADETMKIRGQKVSPLEVEGAIRLFPDVKDVAIAPIVQQETGEESFVAFVAGSFDGETFAHHMAEHAHRTLPPHHRPWRFFQIARFPLTANGKVDRHRLKKMAVEQIEAQEKE